MKSNHNGVSKVINSEGDYAFLMESNSIQYSIERNCDLIQVADTLQSTLDLTRLYISAGGSVAGLQGIRHRLHARLTLQSAHRPRHTAAAGGGSPARAQEQVVEGEEGRRAVRHQGQGQE